MEPQKKSKVFRNIVIVFCLIFAVFLSFHGAASYVVVAESEAVGFDAIAEILFEIENRIANSTFDLYITDYTFNWLGVLVLIWFIATVYFVTTRKKLIIGKEYGTAEWGSLKDIKDLFADNLRKKDLKKLRTKTFFNLLIHSFTDECSRLVIDYRNKTIDEVSKKTEEINEKYKNADMPLTETERASIHNFVTNNHVLAFGGSGAGKSRNFVIPNLLQAHSSFVITDPKGEILAKAGNFLRKMEYKIRVLNLDIKSQSDHYNPFHYIHPNREGYEERVLALIETIIMNTDGGEKKSASDPFWDRGEKLFLQAIFFFTCIGFPKEEQNMNTVLWLISLLKIEEENDDLNSPLDHFVNRFAEKFNEKDEDGNVIREHIGVQQYREFREKAAGKTAKSIVITAVARLAPFRTYELARIGSHDTMLLDRVGEEKTAIFVVVPPTDETFNFVAGMLFTQLFQELQYCAAIKYKHKGQRLPIPVRFILDEFANTCKIPNFLKILAYARSFGVGISPILQSLDQAKELYEKQWGTLIDNCSHILFLGSITHNDTLEYFSKLLGKGTYDKRTSSRTYGKSGSSSKSWDSLGRELLTPDEIRTMEKHKCLLFVSGRKPFYSDKFVYESHPRYNETSDGGAPSYEHIPLKIELDKDGKAFSLDENGNKIFLYEQESTDDLTEEHLNELEELHGGDFKDDALNDFDSHINYSNDAQSADKKPDFTLENEIKVASDIKGILSICKSLVSSKSNKKWTAVLDVFEDLEKNEKVFDENTSKSIIETLANFGLDNASNFTDIDENPEAISTITDAFELISKIILTKSPFKAEDIDYESIEDDDDDTHENFDDFFDELRNELIDDVIDFASSNSLF